MQAALDTEAENGYLEIHIKDHNDDQHIRGISVLRQWVLFVEKTNGFQAIYKNGSSHSVTVTGLDDCKYYFSLHTMRGMSIIMIHQIVMQLQNNNFPFHYHFFNDKKDRQ